MKTPAKQALASVQVPETVAAGAYHSLALRKSGEVWAWGNNLSGQLGTASTQSTASPARVPGLPGVKALAAGISHSLALDLTGQVWAWGQNASGQVGLGSVGGTVLTPTKVAGLPLIQRIAAGGSYSLALDADGKVWAWGQNTSGQVGTGAISLTVATPVQVTGLPPIQAIAGGVNHALALDVDGNVWAWGQNTSGQVGTGAASTSVLVPVKVAGLPGAKAIAAGAGHSLVIDTQFGNVWAWGQNNFGQVGTGSSTTTPVLAPTPVGGVFAGTSIVAGHYFSLVIMGNGFVKAWGQNNFGQIGNGTTTNSPGSVDVTELGDAKAISAGAQHALAVRPGCPVWAWGSNGQGRLGNGSMSEVPATVPTQSQLTNTFYFDGDGDGFGDEFANEQACTPSPGFVEEIDCDDFTSATHPGAAEACNGVDDNCDTVVDDGNPGSNLACPTTNLGVCAAGTTACTDGTVVCVQNVQPSNEQCDGLDNDCDGEADEGNPGGSKSCSTGLQGVCASGVTYCTTGTLHCVQQTAASSEVCDAKDNDCNGSVDDGLATKTWYRDADGDGYGSASTTTQNCLQPAGYVANALDCNDANASTRPGAAEACDGVDNNCNGQVDENVQPTWYWDGDRDGYGNPSVKILACSQPGGYVSNAVDCNDASAISHPWAGEVCDALDNNCNGQVDEGVQPTWYRDADKDAYGNPNVKTLACSQPSGYVSNSRDCNDSKSTIKPGAKEVCDGVDNDCDGREDEGVTTTYFRDADGDRFGKASAPKQACSSAPSGYVSNGTDCNDANATTYPGALEYCWDAVDSNCNGTIYDCG
ncbi:MopE-related protein [Pyxidicoccus trucidator]|uniref:RCC1 domain-containing protein n=1 Tax=Pyxidicoccus trucidator TaxID=2709662 RepID=UPI0013DD6263|nr:MopE-related protein [Pyxidicoccus trucidator]